MTQFSDLEFECPYCRSTHNVRKWLKESWAQWCVMDPQFTEDLFLGSGRLGVQYLGLHCSCGRDYSLEAVEGRMVIRYRGEVEYDRAYEGDADE